MEIFSIMLKKDRNYNKLVLGKFGKNKEGQEKLGIYELVVNNTVKTEYYFRLLKEGDFSNTNFRIITFEELENIIKENQVIKVITGSKEGKIKDFFKKLLTQ